ncbi:MAG: DNA-cytosine methyltransferase [Myxococcales bacterium]|nr:DNA-cytosine methyltransferase [Myxococcales bacterium]
MATRRKTTPKPLPLLRAARARAAKAVNHPIGRPLKVAGLFAGVGGIETGLHRAGHQTSLLCEWEPAAQAVLADRFAEVPLHDDVRTLARLPKDVDLLTAGFPCQDLSQAGTTAGISGLRSGLVTEVFRLLSRRPVEWVLLENVPFMLQLARGRALEIIIGCLEELGYKWAYRVVTAQAFGLPQRRERVFLLASQEHDPRPVLLSDDIGEKLLPRWQAGKAFGFYWTEGVRGLGAAVDAVPTLKGGSTIGIPSPPAILRPDGLVVTPDIRDAERLQGLAPGWTEAAERVTKRGGRWKLVGNAVCANVAEWIGKRLIKPGTYDGTDDAALLPSEPWPRCAWNIGNGRRAAPVSAWPENHRMIPIGDFLEYPVALLSERATAGFLSRARSGSLRFPEGFLSALEEHRRRQNRASATQAFSAPLSA